VEGLEAQARLEEGRAVIDIQAVDEDGQPLNYLSGVATIVSPELEAAEVAIEQVGPGRYRAESRLAQPGTYLVRLGVNQGDQSLWPARKRLSSTTCPPPNRRASSGGCCCCWRPCSSRWT
jgi:hypothetical protein